MLQNWTNLYKLCLKYSICSVSAVKQGVCIVFYLGVARSKARLAARNAKNGPSADKTSAGSGSSLCLENWSSNELLLNPRPINFGTYALSASLEEKMNKLRTEIKIVVSRKMKSARLCLVCHEFMTFSCLFFLFISWTYESSPERNRLIMRLGRRASSRMEMKNVRKRVLASWPLTFPVDEVLQQALSTDFALALLPVQGWIGGIRDLLYEWRWWQRIESEKRMEKHVFDGLMNLASTTVDNPPKLVLRVDWGLFQRTKKKPL